MTNYQDRIRRLNRSAILTEEDVRRIKERLGHYGGKREWPRDIAKEYMVGTETIRRIDRGDTWGWLLPEHAKEPVGEAALAAAAEASLAKLKEGLK